MDVNDIINLLMVKLVSNRFLTVLFSCFRNFVHNGSYFLDKRSVFAFSAADIMNNFSDMNFTLDPQETRLKLPHETDCLSLDASSIDTKEKKSFVRNLKDKKRQAVQTIHW
ncbi:hypothetical protein AVEN_13280-1 [Araneus ventricosus]|uniref:Uncharacterized protein n=1 Tax=Araneus ventricosus TaxID=182803 RepID=A0A4Y2EY09_ARAVE|nr:hypothetical protein AVEN_13280-1 [Araneus ventricosus]